MVDAGKVKQNSYDLMTESSSLDTIDISKACAKQRAGRAGRIQNGFAYRLYSIYEYESMANYAVPDMLRISLHDICLKVKMLAADSSIKQFLSDAIQSPSQELIQNSIEILMKIGALDTNENVTLLGNHLSQMPVNCQLGKMILYSIFFRCMDPVLTIVSALSVKNLMRLWGSDNQRNERSDMKELPKCFSDHQRLLIIYEEWQGAENKNEFCSRHSLSKRNMKKVERVRNLLMHHLKIAKYIRNDNEIINLNHNSMRFDVVKACITAGLYRKYS